MKKSNKQIKARIEKGDYGYLKKNKLIQLIVTLVLMSIVCIIFYTGYIKYGNTKNIFTVFAILSVLPMAKFVVGYLMIVKHSSISIDEYNKIQENIKHKLIYDLIISSPERTYPVKVVIVQDNSVCLYIPDEKVKKIEAEKYVRSFLEKECKVSAVKVACKLDEFIKIASSLEKNESGRYDKRISELLLIYSL